MTLATRLTVGRLVAAPVFAGLLLRESVPAIWYASAVFVAAAITDRIDGWLARRTNTVTPLGRMLDPLADKLLVAAAFVGFRLIRVPGVEWWMVGVILGRELLVTWLRSHVGRRGVVIHSSPFAKWKTTVQMVVVLLFLALMSYRAIADRSPTYWKQFGEPATTWLFVAMVATAAVTLLSGLDYVFKNRREVFGGTGRA
ncbi:MAG: CDP-diacylglycerol--glycerol-3-phosphate 3-phosphatidyltransferase [Gemmatimonadetes bacterium]|nr:CDP-diacylglycerol--glycerol-3-phosphate 3-phosphatidyltransferase [Gemmatimonadota bacterium]